MAMIGFNRLASPMELSTKVFGFRSTLWPQAKRTKSEVHKNKKVDDRERRRERRLPDITTSVATVFLREGCGKKHFTGFSVVVVFMAKIKG